MLGELGVVRRSSGAHGVPAGRGRHLILIGLAQRGALLLLEPRRRARRVQGPAQNFSRLFRLFLEGLVLHGRQMIRCFFLGRVLAAQLPPYALELGLVVA